MNPAPRTATVLSLGAGVQSSALLLMCDREPERVGAALGVENFKCDFAVFADTGDEPDNVYRWLDRLERAVSIPVVRASAGSLAADILANRTGAEPPWFVVGAAGKKGMLRRQCTRTYKVDVVRRAIRERLGYKPRVRVRRHHVTQLIGISRDEVYRIKPSRKAWITNRHPLVDLKMVRGDCRAYVEATGLGTPPRSACWHCPFHSDAAWARLRDHEPEAFAKAVAFDRAIRERTGRRTLRGTPFLHRDRVPLSEVVLRPKEPAPDLFNNECEGMCGV